MLSLKPFIILTLAGAALCLPCLGGLGAQQGSPSGTPPSRDGPDVLANAIRLHQSGDLEGAIREYRIFLAAAPDDKSQIIAYSNLGAALARLGRYGEAIEQYQKALRATSGETPNVPGAADVRFNLALAYYKAGQIPDAAREFATLSGSLPTNMNVVLLLADCHLRMGENKQVVELLSPLEPVHEQDRALNYLLGTALIRDHQIDRGQKLIDRILRDGDSAEARLLIGSAKVAVHDTRGAMDDLKRAIELNPTLPSAHAFYARALLDSGSQDRARKAFAQELEINPNDFDSNFYLGVLARKDQKYDDALRFLKRALEVRPGDTGVRYQIGALDLSIGKTEDAQRELEQVIQDSPDFVEAHVSLATVYYREKRQQDADRERAVIDKLNAEIQARQTGVQGGQGTANRGVPQPAPH